MSTKAILNRTVGVLLIAALATATLAPAAAAGRGRVRYKRVFHGPRVVRVIHRGPVIVERHSDLGAVVGFLGGLVVGSVLSNTPPVPPPAVYEYYDPYCHRRFATLEAYDAHLYRHPHPRRLEVIEVHSGRCVDIWDWRDGNWHSQDEEGSYAEEWDE